MLCCVVWICWLFVSYHTFMRRMQELCAREVGRNELMLNMLRLMKLLVAYGFYCKWDAVEPVITLLTNIIGKIHQLSSSHITPNSLSPFQFLGLGAAHVDENSTKEKNENIFAIKSE